MSLLLDALDRADKGRRDGRPIGTAPGEASGDSAPPATGQGGEGLTLQEPEPGIPASAGLRRPGSSHLPPDARALFELPAGPKRSRSWLPWATLALAVCGAGGISVWLLNALQPANDGFPPTPRASATGRVPGAVPGAVPGTGATAVPALMATKATKATLLPGMAATGPTIPLSGTASTADPRGALASARRPAASRPGRTALATIGPGLTTTTPTRQETAARLALTEPRPDRPFPPLSGASSTAPKTVAPADVQLFRRATPVQPDPELAAAWTALRDGHLDEARERYLHLEQRQPDNVDVQLGLATIAAERNQPDQARTRYQRVLVQDPLNRTAQAGLAVLMPAAPGGEIDSALNHAAAGQDPGAQYALAARLSAAGRWAEAEQAWFDALQADPDQPDMLYNLAVALDHLNHGAAAVAQYRAALAASQQRHAHFSRQAIETRLQALAAP